MSKCLLSHCKNSSTSTSTRNVVFFRLPFWDSILKTKWLNALKMHEPVNPEDSFICSLHFSPNCIENGVLKSESIPTIDVQKVAKEDRDVLRPECASIDEMKKEAECDLSFRIFGYTCRICGCSTEDIEDMESIMDESNNFLEKITQCLPVIIEESDSLPLYMCMDCVDELEASYRLIQKALFTEEQLLEKLYSYTGNFLEDQESDDDMGNLPILDLEGPVICDFCGDMFSNIYILNAHIEKEINDHNISMEPDSGTVLHTVCSLCGKVFLSIGEYEAHKSKIVNTCTECQEVFTSACDLIRHNKDKCQTKFYCSQCFKTFLSSDLLELHKQKHNNTHWFCYICETSWDNSENLMTHSCIKQEIIEDDINHLNVYDGLILKNKPYGFECTLCDRTYKRHTNLAKHWATHKKGTNHQLYCKYCNITLDTRQDLTMHMSKLHGKHNKMFVCRFCGKSMTTKLSLNIHERIHMCIKPYICEWCGNEFRSKANLSQHQAKHTGIRKHKCGICGKLFSRKAFVTTHMRTHTGERPYSCDLCEQRFSQIGDMRRHRKRHDVIPAEKKKNGDQTVIIVEQKDITYINSNQELSDSIQLLVKSDSDRLDNSNPN